MTHIIRALAEVQDGYDVLYCDLWGCLHDGKAPFPSAVSALRAFRTDGRRVVLLTNAPRPSGQVIGQLDRMGVPRDAWDEVVSSGDAAQDAMLQGEVGTRVWHLGPEKDDSFFTELPADRPAGPVIERVPVEAAEGIVCTGLFDDLTEHPDHYRERLQAAADRGLPMLCANPDIVVDLGHQRLWCAGALAEVYEQMGGRTIYAGKPHSPIYELAARRLGLGADARILATGDGIATDVAGAVRQGIDSLFITGGLAFDQFGVDVENPEHGLLRPWLDERALTPTFAIGKLR